jgi:hypothetical protein
LVRKPRTYYENFSEKKLKSTTPKNSVKTTSVLKKQMKKYLFILVLILLALTQANSQVRCGFDDVLNAEFEKDREYSINIEEVNAKIKEQIIKQKAFNSANGTRSINDIVYIPVVFHILHRGGAIGAYDNPTDASVISTVDYLNKVYDGTWNGTGGSIRGVGDINIKFVLATKDPDNNTTTGIERIDASSISDYSTSGLKLRGTSGVDEATLKNLSRWDSFKYYNIWVVHEIDGCGGSPNNCSSWTGGFAYFPYEPVGASTVSGADTRDRDGTVMLATGMVPGNKLLPHEIGHALNLYHPFQGTDNANACPPTDPAKGDMCADTDPITNPQGVGNQHPGYARDGFPYTLPNPNSCAGGKPYNEFTEKNFMNYTFATRLFTADQKNRMKASVMSTIREGLSTSWANNKGTYPTTWVAPKAATVMPVTSATGMGAIYAGIYRVELNDMIVNSLVTSQERGYLNNADKWYDLFSIKAGLTYTMKVNILNGGNNNQLGVYIDYNNDGAFNETTEKVFLDTNIPASDGVGYTLEKSITFTVPVSDSMSTGSIVRMRVINDLYSFAPNISGSSSTLIYGQAEDYAIYLGTDNTVTLSSAAGTDSQTTCINTAIVSITYATTGATGATFSGLPTGVSGDWSANVVTISGTPSVVRASQPYTVTLTGGSGTVTTTGTLTVISTISPSFTQVGPVCSGASLSALPTTSTNGITGTWSPVVNNTTTTNYTFTPSEEGQCTTTASMTITVNTLPTTAITNNTATTVLTCSTTAISVTATGGVSYAWNNGLGNDATASITAAGTYIVIVTNANGCTDTESITITENKIAPTTAITNNTATTVLTCSTAVISVTATGGVSYAWNNSLGNDATASITAAGTYIVTVTNANGCTDTESITITENKIAPTAAITNNTATTVLTCSTAVISVTATGGVSYAWNNSLGNNATASITTAGTYIVTVTNANGCTDTESITITKDNTSFESGITINPPTVTQSTCAVPTGEIVVNATTITTGTLEYSIDNGTTYQTDSTFSSLEVGDYTIKVKKKGSSCTETYADNPVAINPLLTYTNIYVNKTATGNNNGISWEDAFTDLQDAIDANCSNVDVWVAKGTYYPTKDHTGNPSPTKNRDKNFHLGTNMKIYGGFAGGEAQLFARDAATNVTILSGDFDDNDDIASSGSTLTITNNAENAYHVLITANLTAATVIDGFIVKGGNANASSAITYKSESFSRIYGGGIINIASSPTITNSTFTNNYANYDGGGIYNDNSSPTITNSTFTNNKASNLGSGMYNDNSSPTITNSTFTSNYAFHGGGIYNDNSSPTITNSTFSENYVASGGGIYNDNSSPTITNSTFTNNKANSGGGGMDNSNSSPTITNSIFWNNVRNGNNSIAGADISNSGISIPMVTYCLTQANSTYSGGTGIINNQSPLFVDAANDNFSLYGCSPAINAGTAVLHTTDILGNSLIGTVDMGAHEYQGVQIVVSMSAPTVTQPTCTVLTGTIIVKATTTAGILAYSIDNGISYQTGSTFSGLEVRNYTIKVKEKGSSCTETYADNPVAISPSPTYTSIYVNRTATGNNDGTSWADAFTDLQNAIDANCSGVNIWVAKGTYYPTKNQAGSISPSNNRDKNFHLGTDMKIYGGFAGGETELSERNAAINITTLSGDFDRDDIITGSGSTLVFTNNAENAYHVIITVNLTFKTVIDGFKIKGGNANVSTNITYQTIAFNRSYGGGIYNVNSSPTITNSTFKNNKANYGGGMYNKNASPTITNATFTNNKANYGGGMSNSSASPTITHSTFNNNKATNSGGGIYNYISSSPTITNSIIWNNDSSGIANRDNSTPIFKNSIIKGSGGSGASWVTTYGGNGGNNLDSDPFFVNATNDDVKLKCNSPAIDQGILVGAPTKDITGTTRIGLPDMGAYEYIASAPLIITEGIANGTNPTYEGTSSITSQYPILNTNNALFKAQKFIELKPGFEVAPAVGAATVFRAEIGNGCPE